MRGQPRLIALRKWARMFGYFVVLKVMFAMWWVRTQLG
jgi:hypothetical protein